MLQIRKLNIAHKKDLHTILTDFHFVLNTKEKAAIIGEEGNGKSTLLKWIYDPQLIEKYAEAVGERICSGERLGYLPQELPKEEEGKTLYEFFCEEPLFWEKTPKELNEIARNLNLPIEIFYGEQYLGTLSGGEKVKVQIARILIAKPTVLLLDEPSNDIDIETLEWLERFIRQCDQSVLYISHDETLIERTANVIIHMEQLRRKTVSRYTVVRTDYREYMRNRIQHFAKQEQEALNEKRAEQIRDEKFRKLFQSVEHELRSVSRQDPGTARLLKKKMKAVKSMEHRYERETENRTHMPEQEDAIFIKFGEEIQIPAGKVILNLNMDRLEIPGDTLENNRILAENISLYIRGGQKVCIIGQNGVGKTTLLKRIASELLERTDIKAAYMPQNYEELLDMNQNAVEFLDETGDKEIRTRIRTYLGAMKYTAEEMSHSIAELSGGQKAKLLLLKMSMSGANVLILDEPTRNFSPLSAPVIREVLASYQGVIISISHDRKYIDEVCDYVYCLTKDGLNKIKEP